MTRCLIFLLLLGVAGTALAADTGNRDRKADLWQDYGDGRGDGREGGESIGSAIVIPALPFNDTGATCDNVNDYDEVCPYMGSTSADVVYAFTPSANVTIAVDLCASSYDTKTYIYAGQQGNLVACNDDAGCGYSGYQSKLEGINLTAGTTYYIVIDGYGGSCGSYILSIAPFEPCTVDCPPEGRPENEPPCVDNYYDQYNGGCNTTGWTLMPSGGDGCGAVCGKGCTYIYQGGSYRDTDWYQCWGQGTTVTANCVAEFPLQFIFIYNADCNNLMYNYITAGPCQTATLSQYVGSGVEIWLWVGPSVFSGVPESDYVLDACGIWGDIGTPVQDATWGAIKNRFR